MNNVPTREDYTREIKALCAPLVRLLREMDRRNMLVPSSIGEATRILQQVYCDSMKQYEEKWKYKGD